MKKFLLLTAVAALSATAGAQTNVPSVTAAEYFIGTDPGAGSATPIPLVTSNSIVGVSDEVSLNVSGLDAGTYTVGVRFKDATGQWGNPVYQRFTVYPSDYQGALPGPEGPAATLSAAEYFIGVDPGAGNGTPLTLAEAGRITSQTTELPINISSLAAGTYSVGVRFKSADGVWGNPVYQRFTVYPDNYQLATPADNPDANPLRVVAAEYFLGNDPGAGRGTQIPIETAALVGAIENVDVPIASLGQGTYRVGVRFKSADGTWGNPVYSGFTIYDFENAPVNRAPSALYLTSTSFNEGVAVGTVVSALSTADPDGDTAFTYELVPGEGSANNGVFTIQGSFLKTAAAVDYEILANKNLSIRVKTTDAGGLSLEQIFTVTVLNVTTDDDDGDGLTEAEEQALGTNPLLADTDGDGLSDKAEQTAGTNPLLADTDGDGFNDKAEIDAGTNAKLASSFPYPVILGWGRNEYGQTNGVSTNVIGTNGIALVDGGMYFSVGLRGNGTVFAWGGGPQGQTNIPAGLTNVVSLDAGEHNSIALRADGTVAVWGSNDSGQTNLPAGLTNVVDAAISGVGIALKSDGTVLTWGTNGGGVAVPSSLAGGRVVGVAAGTRHWLALKSDGTVVAWGSNPNGQTSVPAGLSNVVAVAADVESSFALKADGKVVGWGTVWGNTNLMNAVSNGVTLSANWTGAGVLKADRTPAVWGENNYGQTNLPAGLTNLVQLAAGGNHYLAIKSSGSAPRLTTPLSLTGVPNANFSYTIATAQGSPNSYTALGLPSGLSLNPTSGVISGTVTGNVTQSVRLIAKNGAGQDSRVMEMQFINPNTPPSISTFLVSSVTEGAGNRYVGYVSVEDRQDREAVTPILLVEGTDGNDFALGTTPFAITMEARLWSFGMWGFYITPTIDYESKTIYSATLKAIDSAGLITEIPFTILVTNDASSADDSDADGLPDDWEVDRFGGTGPQNGAGDADGDGMTNGQEYAAGTNPNSRDSDNDGVTDSKELADGTNPNNANSYNSISRGLMAHYASSNPYLDSSGYGNHLETRTAGVALSTNQRGVSQGGIRFQNNSDSATSTKSLGLAGNASFAYSLWIKFDQSPDSANRHTLSIGQLPSSINGNGSSFVINNGPGGNIANAGTWADVGVERVGIQWEGWHHFVYVYSGSLPTSQFYFDGVPLSNMWVGGMNRTAQYNLADAPVKLGFIAGVWEGIPGANLSDIRIYNRTLSSAEVGQIYQQEAGSLDTDGDGLTDAWERGYGRYQIVSGSFTWDQAKADAEARGGHLVTITSQDEWNVIWSLLGPNWGATVYWMGGTDQGTDGNWRWITEENWSFNRWYPSQPSGGGEHQLLSSGNLSDGQPGWNDGFGMYQPGNFGGYILEFGYPTDPTKADTDGDGFNDSIESHYASDPNNAVVTPNTIRPTGAVIAWGDNQAGQTNVPVSISTNAIQVSSGYAHALALKKDGSVVAWGENLYAKSTMPGGLTNVVSVSAGAEHSVALLGSGQLRVWGDNRFGQTNVPGEALTGIVAVQAGQVHTLALTAMGKVLAWGSDESGQCTVPAEALAGIVAIGAGERHSIALTAAGKVIAWGAGQTNSGSYPNLGQSIVPPVALSGVDAISAYNCSNLILKDGQVLAWGDNYGGQVSPLPAESQSGVTQISLGLHHASALKSNGQVIAWGRNQYGQATPPVITQSGALAVSAGGGFTAAIVSRNSDLEAPVITLIGSDPLEIYKGSAFTDPGATVTDNVDATRVIMGSGAVVTSTVGFYTVSYNATDAAGNIAASESREVRVVLNPAADEDGDGLTNGTEISGGTNPYQRDSDGDGVNDPLELADGTNPNNSSSYNNLNKGLVAYYPFNGNSNDASGNGNHANLSSQGQLTADRFATQNSALFCTAGGPLVSQIAESSQNIPITGNSDRTIVFWCKFSTQGTSSQYTQTGVEWGTTALAGGMSHVSQGSGNGGVWVWGHYADVDAIPVNASPYNQWRQIVLSYGGSISNGKIYIDGASVPISNIGRLNQRDTFATIATTLRLKGGQGDFLDDIRIYNRALSSAEVGQLYQNEAGTLDTDGDGLTDAWERGYGRYQIVSGNFTWEQAKANAESRKVYLNPENAEYLAALRAYQAAVQARAAAEAQAQAELAAAQAALAAAQAALANAEAVKLEADRAAADAQNFGDDMAKAASLAAANIATADAAAKQAAAQAAAYVVAVANANASQFPVLSPPIHPTVAQTGEVFGHLATFTSASEREMVYGASSDLTSGAIRPWLGGTDKNSEGNWRWITGEAWNYNYWYPQEPSNYSSLQHYLWSGWGTASEQKWDDWYLTSESITPGESGPNGYIVEYGYPTDPTRADTDGDGVNDKEETLAGTDPNNATSGPAPQAPLITSDNMFLGQVGVPFSNTVTASGTAPITFSANSLPAGLILSSSTGLISGVPTEASNNGEAKAAAEAAAVAASAIAAVKSSEYQMGLTEYKDLQVAAREADEAVSFADGESTVLAQASAVANYTASQIYSAATKAEAQAFANTLVATSSTAFDEAKANQEAAAMQTAAALKVEVEESARASVAAEAAQATAQLKVVLDAATTKAQQNADAEAARVAAAAAKAASDAAATAATYAANSAKTVCTSTFNALATNNKNLANEYKLSNPAANEPSAASARSMFTPAELNANPALKTFVEQWDTFIEKQQEKFAALAEQSAKEAALLVAQQTEAAVKAAASLGTAKLAAHAALTTAQAEKAAKEIARTAAESDAKAKALENARLKGEREGAEIAKGAAAKLASDIAAATDLAACKLKVAEATAELEALRTGKALEAAMARVIAENTQALATAAAADLARLAAAAEASALEAT